MALHFSSERPEDQFYTDFGNLNKFNEEVSMHMGYADVAVTLIFVNIRRFLVPINAQSDLLSLSLSLSLSLQQFSQLSAIVFNFLVAPQQVSFINSDPKYNKLGIAHSCWN